MTEPALNRIGAHAAAVGQGAILRLDAVTKRFGPIAAVDGVDLLVSDGEFLTVVGPSGHQ